MKFIQSTFSILTALVIVTILSGSDLIPPPFIGTGQVLKLDKDCVEFSLDWQAHMQRYKSIYKFKKSEKRYATFFSIINKPEIGKNFVTDQNRKKFALVLEKEEAEKTIPLN